MTNIEKNNNTPPSYDNPWLKEGLFDDITPPTFDNSVPSSEIQAPARELPTTSPDLICKFYLKAIERNGHLPDVQNFLAEAVSDTPKTYSKTSDFISDNENYKKEIDSRLSPDEKNAILDYSGYQYAWINSVLRGFWDYERLGKKTEEQEAKFKETAKKINTAIKKSPAPKESFVTFRGTNLDNFRNYGIKYPNINIFWRSHPWTWL